MKNRVYQSFDKIRAEEKLKQDTYQSLQKKLNSRRTFPIKRLAIAGAVVVSFILSFFAYDLYRTEAAYLDLDVNPSIELTLNRYHQVIGAYAYNEEGKAVLDTVQLKNKSYTDALKDLVESMVKLGYIEEEADFTATLQMKDSKEEKKLLKELQDYLASLLKSESVKTSQEVFTVDAKTKAHAHQENLTPAKYLAILELQEVDATATIDSCRHQSIGQIKKQTHAHHAEQEAAKKAAESSNSESTHESSHEAETHANKAEQHEQNNTEQHQNNTEQHQNNTEQHQNNTEQHQNNTEQHQQEQQPEQHAGNTQQQDGHQSQNNADTNQHGSKSGHDKGH